MKHIIIYILNLTVMLTAIATLHGCDAYELDDMANEGEALQLSVDIGAPASRATDYVRTLTFETGDAVGVLVFEDGTYKGNYKYVKQANGSWNTSGTFYRLPKNETTPMQYVVYAPYQTSLSISSPYNHDAVVSTLKTKVYPKTDQSTEAKYRECDLLTKEVISTSATTHISAHLDHEYAVVCIDGISNYTYTLINGRDVDYQNTFKSIEFKLNDTDEYTPYFNNSDYGGDDYYRVIVPLGSDTKFYLRVTVECSLSKTGKEEKEMTIEKTKTIAKNDLFYYSLNEDPAAASFSGSKTEEELTDEEKIGSIVCVDETNDGTGNPKNHVVIVPRSIFKFSKYSVMQLRPVGVMFSVGTSTADQVHGWTRGYAISLRNAGADGSTIKQYPLINTYFLKNNTDFDFLESRYEVISYGTGYGQAITGGLKDVYDKVCTFLNGYSDMLRVKDYCTTNSIQYDATSLANVRKDKAGGGSAWPAVWVAEHFDEEYADDTSVKDSYEHVKGRFWLPKGPTTDKHSSGWYLISAGQCILVVKDLASYGHALYYTNPCEFSWGAGSSQAIADNFNEQMAYIDRYMEYDGAVVIHKEDRTTVPKYWQRLNPDYDYTTLGICLGLNNQWDLLDWDMNIGTSGKVGIGGFPEESLNRLVRPVFAF